MAYVSKIFCVKCREYKSVTVGSGEIRNVCHECEQKQLSVEEDQHIKGLKQKSLEVRIERIERLLYRDFNKTIDIKNVKF